MSDTAVIVRDELVPEALPLAVALPDLARSNDLVQQAQGVSISDQASYDHACGVLREVKSVRQAVFEKLNPGRDSAWKTYQHVLGLLKEADEPLKQAEATIKDRIVLWDQEQQRIQQALDRQAEAEARRLAEEERLANAVAVEETGGSEEEIAAVLEIPVAPVRVTPRPTYQKGKGISIPHKWCVEVTDIKALCRAIADGKVAPFVTPNIADLNRLASAQRELFDVPGCRAKKVSSVSQRGVR